MRYIYTHIHIHTFFTDSIFMIKYLEYLALSMDRTCSVKVATNS